MAGRPRAGEGPPHPPTAGARPETGTVQGRCFVTAGMVGWARRRTGLCWHLGWAPATARHTPHVPSSPHSQHSAPSSMQPPASSPHGAARCGRGTAAILGGSRAEPGQSFPAPARTRHAASAPSTPTAAPRTCSSGAATSILAPALDAPAPTMVAQPPAPLAVPGPRTGSPDTSIATHSPHPASATGTVCLRLSPQMRVLASRLRTAEPHGHPSPPAPVPRGTWDKGRWLPSPSRDLSRSLTASRCSRQNPHAAAPR